MFREENARKIKATIKIQRGLKQLIWVRNFTRYCNVKKWLREKLWRLLLHMRIVKKIKARNVNP